MIVLLCLTPVFKNMPQNAQGAVIIAAVVGLFNYDEWWFLLKVCSLAAPQSIHPAMLLVRPQHLELCRYVWQDLSLLVRCAVAECPQHCDFCSHDLYC